MSTVFLPDWKLELSKGMLGTRKIDFEAILISSKSKSFPVPLLTVWVWCPFYVWFLGLFELEPLFGLRLGVIQKRCHLKIKISKGFSVLLKHGIYVLRKSSFGVPHPFLPLEVTSFMESPLGPCQPLVCLLKPELKSIYYAIFLFTFLK